MGELGRRSIVSGTEGIGGAAGPWGTGPSAETAVPAEATPEAPEDAAAPPAPAPAPPGPGAPPAAADAHADSLRDRLEATLGGVAPRPAPADPALDAAKREVIDIVAQDPESLRRVDSWLKALPGALGVSGSIRNLGYIFTGQDPSEPAIAAKACTGIADATSSAIARGIDAGRIPGVARATTIDRQGTLGTFHTATLVTLKDGREFVFDWHATLDPRNPQVMPKSQWLPH
jgi:hypothetical protein